MIYADAQPYGLRAMPSGSDDPYRAPRREDASRPAAALGDGSRRPSLRRALALSTLGLGLSLLSMAVLLLDRIAVTLLPPLDLARFDAYFWRVQMATTPADVLSSFVVGGAVLVYASDGKGPRAVLSYLGGGLVAVESLWYGAIVLHNATNAWHPVELSTVTMWFFVLARWPVLTVVLGWIRSEAGLGRRRGLVVAWSALVLTVAAGACDAYRPAFGPFGGTYGAVLALHATSLAILLTMTLATRRSARAASPRAGADPVTAPRPDTPAPPAP